MELHELAVYLVQLGTHVDRVVSFTTVETQCQLGIMFTVLCREPARAIPEEERTNECGSGGNDRNGLYEFELCRSRCHMQLSAIVDEKAWYERMIQRSNLEDATRFECLPRDRKLSNMTMKMLMAMPRDFVGAISLRYSGATTVSPPMPNPDQMRAK